MTQDRLETNIDAVVELLQSMRRLAEPLNRAADLVTDCLLSGCTLLTCGNGGSAADAAHITTELVCRLKNDRPPYPSVCLNDSGSTLTATANDYGYEEVFARQVRAFGQAGNVLLAISTSGNSENIVRALEAAREAKLASIALLGRDGGQSRGLATVELIVPSQNTARIQEAHTVLYHTLCEMIEPALAGTT